MRGRSVKLWIGIGLLVLGTTWLGSALPPPAPSESVQQVPARRLWPGDSVTRKLRGGHDVHAYEIPLEAGQVFRGEIVARGIDDLRVALSGPTGERLLDLEAASGGLPPEPLVAVAEASGGYRLEIEARRSGTYELSLDPARPAVDADRRRAAAAFHLSNGLALRRAGDASSRRQAAEELRRAFGLWDPIADRRERAITLLWLGQTLQGLEKYADARQLYEQALSMLHAEGDLAGKAFAVDCIGRSYYFQDELEHALELYHRALTLYHENGDRAGEADTLSNIALVHKSRWQIQDAQSFYHQALARWRDLGGRDRQAGLLVNIGRLYLAMGKNDEAFDSFEKALALQQGLGDLADQAAILSAMGAAHQSLGHDDQALDCLQEALKIRERLGNEREQMYVLLETGWVHLKAGRHKEAEAALQRALGLARRNEDRRGGAHALGNLARLLDLDGREREAIQLFAQARALAQEIGDPDAEARTLHGAAQARRDLGDLAAARSLAATSLDLSESVRAGTTSQDLRSSFGDEVHERYALSIDLLMQSHRFDPGKGFDVQAFEVAERARARSVLDEIAESQADLRTGVDPGLVEREKKLLVRINVLEAERQGLLARPQDAGAQRLAPELERRLSALLREHDLVLSEIRAASPRYAALIQPRPLTLAEIRREVLDDETLLLSFVLGEPRSFLFLTGPRSLDSFELPGRGRIETQVHEASRLIQRARNKAGLDEALQELADMLLAPAAGRFSGKRLLIVTDGALHLVPFAALPEPGGEAGAPRRPLVAGHEIVHLPSASALAFLRRDRALRRPAPHAVAVLADPVFGPADSRLAAALDTSSRAALEEDFQDLQPLPWSRTEADAILSFVPDGESFRALGFEANLGTAKSPLLGQYRIVHFATHGKLEPRPELSGIVLSQFDEQGNRREGFLHALDIYGLDLPVELVVLSACETALGKDVRGEGASRLTRGFLYAGAKGVVVSLWRVSDKATAELMTHFYRAMLRDGVSPAAALQRAQLTVRSQRRWESPYYWAGFVLQGDWQLSPTKNRLPVSF